MVRADEQLLNDPNQSFEDPLTARLIYLVLGLSIGGIALVTLFYEVLQKLKVEPNAGQNKGCAVAAIASTSASTFVMYQYSTHCGGVCATEKDCCERTSRTG